jgi:3-deoxy-manno-octulosonate cytidylyltransferase (CMP-KDO synthetase)
MDETAVLSTAVTPIKSKEEFLSPHVVKCVFDQQNNALYFSRAPIPYGDQNSAYAHIGIYCYRTSFLKELLKKKTTPLQHAENLEQLKVLELGHRIKIAIVEEQTLSVDTPQDLIKLEEYLCQQNIFL